MLKQKVRENYQANMDALRKKYSDKIHKLREASRLKKQTNKLSEKGIQELIHKYPKSVITKE